MQVEVVLGESGHAQCGPGPDTNVTSQNDRPF